MIFKKNKPAVTPEHGARAPRGRIPAAGQNPLARRFAQDEEPETIDLTEPTAFPAETTADEEPETRTASAAPAGAASKAWAGVLSHDAESGKFYALPGTPEAPVLLQGEPVTAPTELCCGDRIRVGSAEFEFLS